MTVDPQPACHGIGRAADGGRWLLDALTLVSDEAQGDEGSNITDTGVEDFGPSCTSGLVGVASDGRAT